MEHACQFTYKFTLLWTPANRGVEQSIQTLERLAGKDQRVLGESTLVALMPNAKCLNNYRAKLTSFTCHS